MADAGYYYGRRRSLTGPVILIIVGTLFLLGNLHILHGAFLWNLFARFWPLLLVLAGAIKLIEHYSDQRTGVAGRRMGGGTVALLILLVIFGFAASGFFRYRDRVNWDEMQGDWNFGDNWFSVGGNSYSFENTAQQEIPKGATSVRIVSDRGDVTIETSDSPVLTLKADKKVHAHDQQGADNADKATHPTINVENGTLTVNANTAGNGSKGVQSDLTISIPRKMSVDISTAHGDVTVRDRTGDVHTSTSHGDITLENIAGAVSIDQRRGNVRAEKITGDVTVNGQVNDTTISEVAGNVRLTGDYFGDMNLSKISKGVLFHSSRTDLELAKLDGDLAIQSGDLRATEVAGPLRLITTSKDIHLDGVTGDIRLENKNGLVEVHAVKTPLGTMQIDNSRGDIEVTVPDRAALQVDARANNGDISSEFSSVQVQSSNGNATAKGTIGAGGPQLRISNEHGNVEIKKAT